MSATYTASLVGARTWESNGANAITSLQRTYQIIRNGCPAGTAAEEIVASDVDGLPQPGDAHSALQPDLIATKYAWREGTDHAKNILYCDVGYTCRETETSEANKPPRGQAVEQYGWKSGSVSRDLLVDAGTGQLIVNSAGQPFESTQQVDIPSPVLTVVVKKTARQAWAQHYGKTNAASLTFGGVTYAPHTLRCVQMDEERLWNDDFGFLYRYTVGIQLMTNVAVIGGQAPAIEIGWDLAVIDCGTMERDGNGKLVHIKTISDETGKEVFVSAPVLLDGQGHKNLAQNATPFAKRVQAYRTTTFPEDFYTEPTLPGTTAAT